MKKPFVLVLVSMLGACSVDKSNPVDPEEVPTAAALQCGDGQFVAWRDGAWSCQTPPAADYTVFGSCPPGQKVTGVSAATGAVECDVDADTDTDTDTLGGLTCEGGQVAKWDAAGEAWACEDDLDTDADSLATVGECGEGQVLKWQGGAWDCGADVDTDTDTNSGGTVTSVEAAGPWLSGGTITGSGTIALATAGLACGAGSAIRSVNADGTVTCETDTDTNTTYTNGDGLSLAGTTFAVDATVSRAGHTHTGSDLEAALDAAALCPRLALRDGSVRRFARDTSEITFLLCTDGADEMVKVGDFWIDRYEMSLCPGSGALGGVTGGDEVGGATTTAPACSVALAVPQASITWFQAAQMCANAGKRLCTNAEWQTAASGTPDPGATTTGEECNVSSDGTPATTGSHTDCVSRFGAYDMTGNLWEWVGDWHGKDSATNGLVTNATYGDDYMYDVSPASSQGGGSNFPAAALRGGHWDSGARAGAFALSLYDAPSNSGTDIGVRCCAGGR